MLEIEIKATVSDWGRVERALSAFLEEAGTVDKNDEYWLLPLPGSETGGGFRVRIRTEAGRSTVTYKEKTYCDSIEVNNEVEFGILEEAPFRQFLGKIFARPLYRKRKYGRAWKAEDGVFAELVHVDGLGDYLEVEKVCDDGRDDLVPEVRARLNEVLSRCGIPQTAVEPRPYSMLLGIPRY